MKRFWFVALGLLIAGVIFLIQQTNGLKITSYTWASTRVPQSFDGYCVVLVSDLHNKRFGRDQARLVRAVRELQPDMIALTGDFIDRFTKNLDAVREFLEGVKDLAPLYWVDGNHEPESQFYGEFLALLSRYNVTVLDGYTQIERGGDGMTLAGFSFWDLSHISRPADIVLYHNPDGFPAFASYGYGLVLSGHNHGGQIALPGGKAIFAPGGELFPKYSGGMYTEGEAAMVLSRGLGSVYVPVRAFSRPEVVGVTLKSIME